MYCRQLFSWQGGGIGHLTGHVSSTAQSRKGERVRAVFLPFTPFCFGQCCDANMPCDISRALSPAIRTVVYMRALPHSVTSMTF